MKKESLTLISLFLALVPIFSQEVTMTITSPAFEEGRRIPEKYSCKGEDISPPLQWSDVPNAAVSLVIICDDPDAPLGTWVHWVYFDIPAALTGLPEDVSAVAEPAAGGIQGKNSWRRNDYGGPCPPGGTHRYYFKLYALNATLNLGPEADNKKVEKAMEGHILAEAQLMGTFKK